MGGDPTKVALAACALSLGLMCAGPPWPAAARAAEPARAAKPAAKPAPKAKPAHKAKPARAGRPANAAPVRPPPETVARMAEWVIASGDHSGLPFVIIDKVAARVFVYRPDGRLRGSGPALLGSARGDHSTPGVGDREMSAIRPGDRTTPAGRFVAGFGRASNRPRVLWVDYVTAISLHPVVTAHPKERRPQRLQSPTPRDNRITYGCINVSPAFYEKVVRRTFAGTSGIVYILPEKKPLEEVFPAYRVVARAAPADDPTAGRDLRKVNDPGPSAAPKPEAALAR